MIGTFLMGQNSLYGCLDSFIRCLAEPLYHVCHFKTMRVDQNIFFATPLGLPNPTQTDVCDPY